MVVDGRSRDGYEREVIKQVRDHGGFSIFGYPISVIDLE